MTSRGNIRIKNNPFDDDLIGMSSDRASPLVPQTESVNPFDELMPIQAPPSFGPNLRIVSASSTASGKSTPTSAYSSPRNAFSKGISNALGAPPSRTVSRTERVGSKDSVTGDPLVKADSNSSEDDDEDDDDEEEAQVDDEEDEDDEDDDEYTPDSSSFSAGSSGKNRALVFMETDAPPSAGTIECKLLVLDEGTRFEFLHGPTNRCWMRAQKRTDGLKRLNPAVTVSLWVSPVLLVASHKGHGEEEDANVSFFDVMRELDIAESMQGDVVKRKDNLLKLGKLRGTARGRVFRMWGTGKSYKKALGVMDARPELFALKFQASSKTSKIVIPAPKHPKSRPLKSRDFLLARAKRKDPGVRVIRGSRASHMWHFQEFDTREESGLSKTPMFTISKQVGSNRNGPEGTDFVCTFREMSPAVAFGMAVAIAIKSSSGGGAGSSFLLTSASSLSSLLPRRNSMRRTSLGGVDTVM